MGAVPRFFPAALLTPGRMGVTSRSPNRCWIFHSKDDGELAFIVAHEMAHNISRHRASLRGISPLLAQLGIRALRVKVPDKIEADQQAIAIMHAAGYDLRAPGLDYSTDRQSTICSTLA